MPTAISLNVREVDDGELASNKFLLNGAMPEDRLYQTPFIDIHAQGPDGVFGPARVEQLFVALDGLALKAG